MLDPHNMVKADCFKPNPEKEYRYSHRNNILSAMFICTEASIVGLCNLPGDEDSDNESRENGI